jgi:colanic acid/amylovoran biosynthesis glycosyltransferase
LSKEPLLVVATPLRVCTTTSGQVVLTKKFLDGMRENARRWPGQLALLAEPTNKIDDNLDHVTLRADDLPFSLRLCAFDDKKAVHESISGATVVLAFLDCRQCWLWQACDAQGLPIVHVAEQSLRTRKQIIRAQVKNPLRRVRRALRETLLERKIENAVRNSAGVQCNGTPTYDAYRRVSKRPLLFFDNRVDRSSVVTEGQLRERTRTMQSGCPLRLAFSGRLIAIKGVDHLPRVASELRRLGVACSLDIYGDGDAVPELRREIVRKGLEGNVHLRGVADFQAELLPFMKRHCDMFVCCHRQGDPSCTYLETMACGVPIAGYDNEALRGMLRLSGAGWTVPLDRPELLAMQIAELHANREQIARAGVKAREFATQHAFEETMDRRMAHIAACSQRV